MFRYTKIHIASNKQVDKRQIDFVDHFGTILDHFIRFFLSRLKVKKFVLKLKQWSLEIRQHFHQTLIDESLQYLQIARDIDFSVLVIENSSLFIYFCTILTLLLERLKISFALYPAHSKVGRKKRHSVSPFSSEFWGYYVLSDRTQRSACNNMEYFVYYVVK